MSLNFLSKSSRFINGNNTEFASIFEKVYPDRFASVPQAA